jgi:hypothetical protein
MPDNYLVTGIARVAKGATAIPKFAFASIAAATTDGALVTAVAGKKIRVIDFKIGSTGAATSFIFNTKPAGAGSAVSANLIAPASSFVASSFNILGHFESNTGEGLTLSTGAGTTIAVQITYIEVLA